MEGITKDRSLRRAVQDREDGEGSPKIEDGEMLPKIEDGEGSPKIKRNGETFRKRLESDQRDRKVGITL